MKKSTAMFYNSIELLPPRGRTISETDVSDGRTRSETDGSDGRATSDTDVSDQNDELSLYNNAIRQCMRMGRIEEAEALLMNMDQVGLKPDVLSYNLVMNSCAASGDSARAGQLLDSMLSQNISPNEVTYATICKVLAVNGDVARIQHFLRLLQQSNVEMNVYFYGALISACGRCTPRDVNTAVRAFNEMVALGLRPQSVKKALARAVGVGRASAMISHACRTTVEMQRSYENKDEMYENEKGTAYWGYAATPFIRMSV
eukprot:CAMPEP_0170585036 /NCGR_PEP_ID=MMETSP0224-20130122/8995_1 /TAXON_ID=285029 /ORGANISM="Togula jolla, Strain CCCM 725" /LENGTH=258 /DNA_ID=CAMNT_0010908485 /DNA_START=184 /DNA_END=960 /DNA_ORIENTATION=-